MLQALVLAAHSIEATAAATGPYLLATRAPVQVRLGDGEAQVGSLYMAGTLLKWELCPMAWLPPIALQWPTSPPPHSKPHISTGLFLENTHPSISTGEAGSLKMVLTLSLQ